MPVYEQGYETYAGPVLPLGRRWWPLYREEVAPFFADRRFLFLLFFALVPWLYGVALTFLHTQLGEVDWARDLVRRLPVVDETLVAGLLGNGYDYFLLLIVTVWVGSGLVARDRKDMTLDVFLGRALGSGQYLWAKGAALATFLLLFGLLPTLVLVVFQVGLTGDAGWLAEHARILWGTLLYTAVGPGTLVVFMLALSSLARSPRLVGLAFFAYGLLGGVVSRVLYLITKEPVSFLPALGTEQEALARAALGVEPGRNAVAVPAWMPAAYFGGLLTVSLLTLWVRFARRGVLR